MFRPLRPTGAPALLLLAALLAASPTFAQGKERRSKAEAPKAEAAEQAPLMTPRGPTRIDFDDRLVQGQTNKLGAVYLYQRKTPAQPSLLARRQSFRAEIARDLLE
jgi:hypothetical protein